MSGNPFTFKLNVTNPDNFTTKQLGSGNFYYTKAAKENGLIFPIKQSGYFKQLIGTPDLYFIDVPLDFTQFEKLDQSLL